MERDDGVEIAFAAAGFEAVAAPPHGVQTTSVGWYAHLHEGEGEALLDGFSLYPSQTLLQVTLFKN